MNNTDMIELIMKASERYDVCSVNELITCLENDEELFEGG